MNCKTFIRKGELSKDDQVVKFFNYTDINALNAAKVVLNKVGDCGYWKLRTMDVWEYVHVKELNDEDLKEAVDGIHNTHTR